MKPPTLESEEAVVSPTVVSTEGVITSITSFIVSSISSSSSSYVPIKTILFITFSNSFELICSSETTSPFTYLAL